MTGTPLWRLSILTLPEAEEAVSELLTSATGAPTSCYTDFETRTSHVSVYLSDRRECSAGKLRRLRERLNGLEAFGLQPGKLKLSLRPLGRKSWAESWKRHFPVIEIGSKLVVKPSWSRRTARPNQAVVVLDPGLSFGTGQHPTTLFCLRHLVLFRKHDRAQSLLDMGTGSGILAISAAKMGYAPVDAFDIDPESIRVCRSNARRNGVTGGVRFLRRDLASLTGRPKRYSVVCANLVSDLLIRQRKRIVEHLASEGILLLAGVLEKEFGQVERAYRKAGLFLVRSSLQKEWRSGMFAR